MQWYVETFREECGISDFKKGEEYFRSGRVKKIHYSGTEDEWEAVCTVSGSRQYRVNLRAEDSSLDYSCTCPRCDDYGYCKHIAAAVLAVADLQSGGAGMESEDSGKGKRRKTVQVVASDPRVIQVLSAYQCRASSVTDTPARLVPRLYFAYGQSYPIFGFQVGFDRLYVIRDLVEFLLNVKNRETRAYGKGLTLSHGIEQFDAPSQQIIRLLMDQFDYFRSIQAHAFQLFYIGSASPYGKKGEIVLTGSAFDRMFDLLNGKTVDSTVKGSAVVFETGDPPVSAQLQSKKNAAGLRLTLPEDLRFFGSTETLYARSEGVIRRCSDAFRQRVYPLAAGGAEDMTIALHDLPLFCSYVLPEISDHVAVSDPDGLLREYEPDECTPCFYLDIEDGVLQLRLSFRYGMSEITGTESPAATPHIKRNPRVEQEAEETILRSFRPEPEEGYSLSGEDAIFDFLSGPITELHALGEVYASDRLRAKHIQGSGGSVGVSLSSGKLLLEINTGDFPPEELEALYQSILKKRRYHRLADGRILALNGSSCERIAELTHMLQLPAKELKKGEIELPAFRALYVDDMLNGDSGLHSVRDREFRAMVRNFRAVSESDYPLPERLEPLLRPYQKTGFYWLKTLESCGFGGILADEMGLGKTIQTIAYLLTVRRSAVGLPSLIVCPSSLILNWVDELERFAPELRVQPVMGAVADRKREFAAGAEADVFVTSYELLRQDIERYRAQPFYCCVLDEGQHVKNQATLTSKAVKLVDARQRFVLTGTPIENRLSELWNLFDFLMPGYLFSHRQFVEKLEKPVVKSGDADASAQLRRLVQPFLLRRLKRDVLRELPPKTEHIRRIPMAEEERKTYCAAAAAARESLSGETSNKLAILAALTRLRQICCAPGLCVADYEGASSKLEACLELCAGMVENGHQILLFSQFTSMFDLLRPRLDALGIRSFTLQGSTSRQERARLVKGFNAGEVPVFLISLKAGGTGLNLTAADIVIHYDPWWNLAAQDQATDRAHRIGQQAHVQVYKLIMQDSIEERILTLQSQKAALLDAVSGEDGAAILSMSRDDLLALL